MNIINYSKYLMSAGILAIACILFLLMPRSTEQAETGRTSGQDEHSLGLTSPQPEATHDSRIWQQHPSPMTIQMLKLIKHGNQQLLESTFLEWLEENEAEALSAAEYVATFFPTYNLDRYIFANTIIDYFMQKYGGQDTMEALAMVDPDGVMGKLLYESLTVAWIDESPEAFRQWFRETPILNSFQARNRLMRHEFQHPDLDPVESIQFYEGLEDSDPRKEQSLRMAYGIMVDNQPDAATAYLSTSEPTPEMADGFSRLARDAAESGDIEQMLQWADKIIDEHGLRYQVTKSMLARLGYRDPDKVEAWASTTSFFDGWPQQDIDQWMNDLNDTIQNIDDVPSAPNEIGSVPETR